MTTLPTTLAMIATSLTVSLAIASPSADFNDDGVVDANDLMALTSNLNTPCDGDCQTDLTGDNYTNSSDLIALMQQWGAVPGYVHDISQSNQQQDTTEPSRDPNRDMSWQNQDPVLMDAIYYDYLARSQARQDLAEELNQGALTKEWTANNAVNVQPMSYNGAVDWYEDGVYSEDDKQRFKNWLEETVPADYDGPICLDMEGQWWSMLETSNQEVMDGILDFYIEGLVYVQSLRPNAKIGYWGLPKKSHSKVNTTRASIDRLLQVSTAIFPEVYEYQPDHDDSERLQVHVERCLEMVNGEIPVYVQAFPRYKLNASDPQQFHTLEEFMHDQIQPSMNAVWTDANGKEHRISGIELWDAYAFVKSGTEGWSEMTNEERKAKWDAVDEYHVEILSNIKAVVDVAAGEAQERRAAEQLGEAQAAAEEAAVQAAAQAAAQEEARQAKLARLVAEVEATNVKAAAATDSYNKSSKKYRSARKSWSKSRKSWSKSKRNYKKGSKQYKRAYAQYKKAQRRSKIASRSYRSNRKAYRTARANMNRAQSEWQQANTSETTMIASN